MRRAFFQFNLVYTRIKLEVNFEPNWYINDYFFISYFYFSSNFVSMIPTDPSKPGVIVHETNERICGKNLYLTIRIYNVYTLNVGGTLCRQ